MAKLTLALSLFCSLSIISAAQTVSLPFQRTCKGIAITVRVADRDGFFLLDTGATRTIVTQRISGLSADQLAATAHTKAYNIVLGRESEIPLASLRLTIGKTVFANAYVWISEVKGFDGIIGLDLLSRFKSVKIDYESHLLELEQ